MDNAFVQWLDDVVAERNDAGGDDRHIAPNVREHVGTDVVVAQVRAAAAGGRVVDATPGPISSVLVVTFDAAEGASRARIECHLDDGGRLLYVTPAPTGVDPRVEPSDAIDARVRTALHELFDLTYADADAGYLDRSLDKLGWVATAWDGDALVGFALGDQRVLDLPQVGATTTALAGLACVHPDRRRHGLFRYLANLALRGPGRPPPGRALGAGRMAHPASLRVFSAAPTLVPRRGERPNDLHRAVGAVVADAYGVASFDPETFVCRGSGTPIGYPRMTQEVEDHEWELFDAVDRSRGDALLALIWYDDPPAGW